jgi:Na+/H+ antiporter NhaC
MKLILMSKGLIAFIVVAGIVFSFMLINYMKESADKARKQSHDILEDFKRVDKNLQQSSIQIDSINNLPFYSLHSKKK